MAKYRKQFGLSLTEVLVVVSIVAILMGVSIPAAKHVMASFESSTGIRQLINAALSSARATAVREQTYAGIRFQEDVNGDTYIIFIQHDPDPTPNGTGLANGFRIVTGRKPMKLPGDVGVLSNVMYEDTDLDTADELNDAKTFTIIFSPQGKLTMHAVRIRNYEGTVESDLPSFCPDTVFNIQSRVDDDQAMFYQDDYPSKGFDKEDSVQGFIIFSKADLKTVPQNFRWTNYLSTLDAEYISPYTGELVMEYYGKNP